MNNKKKLKETAKNISSLANLFYCAGKKAEFLKVDELDSINFSLRQKISSARRLL